MRGVGRIGALVTIQACVSLQAAEAIDLGSRRELFVDRYLIDRLDGVSFRLHEPRDEGVAFTFDKPWEGLFSGYCTIIRDGDRLRAYYRGMPKAGADGSDGEATCVAESADGKAWTKPSLGLFAWKGFKENNIVLMNDVPFSHNFSPFLDTRPGCPANERYKAVAGVQSSGLALYASEDGYRWRRLQDKPFLTKRQVPYNWMFDSQNLAFWSEAAGHYVCFFRVGKDGIRRIARTTSRDLVNWSAPELMEYETGDGAARVEQLYTSQANPYSRAPHLIVACAARFMPDRQVISASEAAAIGVNPGYFKDTSDAIFMTSRGDAVFRREVMDGFIRPGIGPRNWVSRTNYPALGVVQTGPTELSLYVNQDYAQPTAHLHRYSLRLDGFMSLHAPDAGGEARTKPFVFRGQRLKLNFATSAAGGIRGEIQDQTGKPIPGFSIDDAVELIGNDIDREIRWKGGADVSRLAGKPIRLRFRLKDADLYSLRFE